MFGPLVVLFITVFVVETGKKYFRYPKKFLYIDINRKLKRN